jgi:hypothetical protein
LNLDVLGTISRWEQLLAWYQLETSLDGGGGTLVLSLTGPATVVGPRPLMFLSPMPFHHI